MKQRMLMLVLLLQLWRDVSEHKHFFFACLNQRLHSAVPGPPTNLMAVPSTSICNEVLFNWNLPPEDERNGITHNIITSTYSWSEMTLFVTGIIRHYRLRVRPVGGGLSGGTFIFDASTTSIVLTTLSCCTSYNYFLSAFTIAYGPSTPRGQLQTYPDLSSEFTNSC